jgi:hypothetical protein
LIAHAFEASDQSFLNQLTIPLVEIIAPQILIGTPSAQEMIDDDEDAVSNRHRRLLCPSSGSNSMILGGKIGVFTMRSSMSGLNEQLTGIRIAFACLARKSFARTLMVARAVG